MAAQTVHHRWTTLYAWPGASDEPFPPFRSSSPLEWAFPAVRSGMPGVRGVRRVCQTASGGSFYAMLGGAFAPGEGEQLVVEVHPGGPDGIDPSHLDPIREGLSAARLPSGTLTLDRSRVHPVDDKRSAWVETARILGEICGLPWDEAALRERLGWPAP